MTQSVDIFCERSEEGTCALCGGVMPAGNLSIVCDEKKRRFGLLVDDRYIRLSRVDVGKAVELVLMRIGITEERVKKLTNLKDCGCPARKRWLTLWGYQQQEAIERVLNAAARFYFGGSAQTGISTTPPVSSMDRNARKGDGHQAG